MSPNHLGVSTIDIFVVAVMDFLADFNCTEILLEHFLDDIHDVSDLHFDNKDKTSTMTRLKIGAVEGKEIWKVRDSRAEVSLCVVIFPLTHQGGA